MCEKLWMHQVALSLILFCLTTEIHIFYYFMTYLLCFSCRCGNVNWARRSDCNMCGHPKFAKVEFRTGD